jgi:ATP-dependent RNA helicase CshB
VYTNDNSDAMRTLQLLLKNINPYFCIIFANTKNEADEIYQFMLRNKYTNTALLHKNLSTRQRKHIFNDINANKYQYLVATDIASRGIDIVGADVVISYGLPQEDI